MNSKEETVKTFVWILSKNSASVQRNILGLTMQLHLHVLEEGVVRGTCSYPSIPQDEDRYTHRLNMGLDLQSLYGHHVHSCTHWLRPRNRNPPPRIWAHIRIYEGAIGQPRKTLLLLMSSQAVSVLSDYQILEVCND